jgi:hypothetical protein
MGRGERRSRVPCDSGTAALGRDRRPGAAALRGSDSRRAALSFRHREAGAGFLGSFSSIVAAL